MNTNMVSEAEHENWMRMAIEQARLAADKGEVPIGAVLVRDGEVLAVAHNQPILARDATAHAEILVLRAASQACGNYRLPGASLYVTIEPCTMCAGALIHARIEKLVFGAREPKAGAIVSRSKLLEADYLNHHPAIVEGVLDEECSALMQNFFRARRQSDARQNEA